MAKLLRPVSATLNGTVYKPRLSDEIAADPLVGPKFQFLIVEPNLGGISNLALYFTVPLSVSEEQALDAVIAAHDGTPPSSSAAEDSFDPSGTTLTAATVQDAIAELDAAKIPLSQKGAQGGVATLDANGKVPAAQLNVSGLDFKGTWDAATNTPTLGSGGAGGVKGDIYIVSVAGSTNLDGISSWGVGDWAVHDGTAWTKVDNTDAVTSVFGRQGAVTAQAGDYTSAQVTDVSTVTGPTVQAALEHLDGAKQEVSEKGQPGGYASLDGTGKLPAAQHGVQTDPSLHALAVPGGNAGFLSGALAQKLTADDVPGDPRPPTAHAATHADGGSDPVQADGLPSGYLPANYLKTGNTLGDQLAGIDAALGNQVVAGGEFFSGYDGVGGTSVGTAPVPIPLSAQHKITAAFAHTAGSPEVTVLTGGTYVIAGRVTLDNSSSSSRTSSRSALEVDRGTGFAVEGGAAGWAYHRTSGNGEDTTTIAVALDLNAGDKLRLVSQRIAGSAPLLSKADGTSLVIFSTVGPQGPPGPPGTGGVALKDDGAPLAGGGNFTSLDFQGPLVSASDLGAGAAGILVEAPFYAYAEEEGIFTMASTTPVDVVTLTFNAPRAGSYKLQWSGETNPFDFTSVHRVLVYLDGASLAWMDLPPAVGNTTENFPLCGFAVRTLTAGSHTLVMQLANAVGTGTVGIRRRRLMVEEMP